MPATPPPDVDLPAWKTSLARIDAWKSDTLFLTHFGPSSPASLHLAEFSARLDDIAGLAQRSLARVGTDEDREAWFLDQMRHELARATTEANARACELAGRLDLTWKGLARYWRTKT